MRNKKTKLKQNKRFHSNTITNTKYICINSTHTLLICASTIVHYIYVYADRDTHSKSINNMHNLVFGMLFEDFAV